jgi:hypothetical protein
MVSLQGESRRDGSMPGTLRVGSIHNFLLGEFIVYLRRHPSGCRFFVTTSLETRAGS